jgi:plastocyanin
MMLQLVALLFVALAGHTVPRTHTVEIRGMEFHPAALTAGVGDTIVWINRDIVPHSATASGQTGWDTGTLTQGQTGRYVANSKGVISYVCTLHPTMHGKLTVR